MDIKTILLIGTFDTKDDELGYMADCIAAQGGQVVTMDVSVLVNPKQPTTNRAFSPSVGEPIHRRTH